MGRKTGYAVLFIMAATALLFLGPVSAQAGSIETEVDDDGVICITQKGRRTKPVTRSAPGYSRNKIQTSPQRAQRQTPVRRTKTTVSGIDRKVVEQERQRLERRIKDLKWEHFRMTSDSPMKMVYANKVQTEEDKLRMLNLSPERYFNHMDQKAAERSEADEDDYSPPQTYTANENFDNNKSINERPLFTKKDKIVRQGDGVFLNKTNNRYIYPGQYIETGPNRIFNPKTREHVEIWED